MTPTRNLSRSDWIRKLTDRGTDYEIISSEVWGRKCRVFKNAPASLRALFEEARSDETFLVYKNERYTFEETWQSSARIASILINQYGIEKGDRVALCLRNYPEWVMIFNAITSIGAIAVAMNALWIRDELAYGLDDSGAKILIADQERLDRLTSVYNKLDIQVVAVRPQKTLPADIPDLSDLMAKAGAVEMPLVPLQGTDPATIFYTSGSTDHPKGVLSCHANIITALLSWELDRKVHEAMLNLTPEAPPHQPGALLAIPLFHVTGSHAVMLTSYRSQRKIVSMYKWDAVEAAKLIELENISVFTAPAAMTGDLVEIGKKTNRDLSSLIAVGGGGAPRAPEQVKNIPLSFANAQPNTGWGMTETNGIGTGIGGEDYLAHPGSSGRCSAVLDIRIVDESNAQSNDESPTGERGEVLIRGASIFKGYWNRPEANAEVFLDEWLRTGDIGYLDEEGYLYIVDRIKDLVIRGGENIACAEVEAALLSHEKILEASAYAVPDARLGEEVGVSLYCSGSISEEHLRLFLSSKIASFKIPRYMHFCEEPLPRIASGKINKRQIREAVTTRLNKPV